MKVVYHSKSDKGKTREHNEDAYYNDEKHSVFMVADGMGGYELGDVASKLVLSTVKSFLDEMTDDVSGFSLSTFKKAVSLANSIIFNFKKFDVKIKNVGTTFVAFLPSYQEGVAINIGDSRLSLFSEGTLKQITKDHSAENDLPDFMKGIGGGKYSGLISKAIGPVDKVEMDDFIFSYKNNDIIMLCTDGLYSMVENSKIESILAKPHNLASKCKMLIDEANKNGGEDNITVTLIEVISMDNPKVLQMIECK